ncbi:CPCC family cysteine-rich protein [Paenibacillus sp. UMB4589-SE434]|uniref:CPCC family cysteine-rich protein n=1 Tax=Paenibacillus sp. UMB4589-SE434 TaxID=3046314 RepID=UPI00254AE615|nr:CPCC family cysteine-rich protein [Paenibacillus sp. UMB4589-SE434]MDK8183362.1 CPCC family cysteine-rich protein [Paenibacillus sp. UMB4589-SE434]
MNRHHCPCCGYPTLEERRGWEICCLCNWEDDGQDDPHADKVRGGPNQDYSLTEARENFKKHYIMYRDRQRVLKQTDKEIQTKKSLIHAFEKLRIANNESTPQIWQEIDSFEKTLDNMVHERVERYSNNIEKNQEIINLINSDDPATKVKGLISLALHADDGEFVQELMVRYSQHRNENIRGIAILCFGHIARIHRSVNKELIIPLIHHALKDESSFVRGHAHSALDDINMFCK